MSTPLIRDTPMTNLPKSIQKQGLLGANLAHVTPLLGLSANPTPSWQASAPKKQVQWIGPRKSHSNKQIFDLDFCTFALRSFCCTMLHQKATRNRETKGLGLNLNGETPILPCQGDLGEILPTDLKGELCETMASPSPGDGQSSVS